MYLLEWPMAAYARTWRSAGASAMGSWTPGWLRRASKLRRPSDSVHSTIDQRPSKRALQMASASSGSVRRSLPRARSTLRTASVRLARAATPVASPVACRTAPDGVRMASTSGSSVASRLANRSPIPERSRIAEQR